MTSKARDVAEPSSETSAEFQMSFANMLADALSFYDLKAAEEFFTKMTAKHVSTSFKLTGKVLVDERIAEIDPDTYKAGIDAKRVTERLKTQFNIDAAVYNEKLFKDLDALSEADSRMALLFAVKAAYLQRKRHRADEDMLEYMMEVAFMRDADAYRDQREVKRLEGVLADLEKKTSLAEDRISGLKAEVTELEKSASEKNERIVKAVLDMQTLRYKSSNIASVKPTRIQRDPVGYLERAIESMKRSADGGGDAVVCACLPVQLFLQTEKDALASALAAQQAQHAKLLDVYECALVNRRRDKEDLERMSRKVAKMHDLQDVLKANDRQLQAIKTQHAVDVDHWRLREVELKDENERLARQCENSRRRLEKQQVVSSSKQATVQELRQVVQELADENEALLGSQQQDVVAHVPSNARDDGSAARGTRHPANETENNSSANGTGDGRTGYTALPPSDSTSSTKTVRRTLVPGEHAHNGGNLPTKVYGQGKSSEQRTDRSVDPVALSAFRGELSGTLTAAQASYDSVQSLLESLMNDSGLDGEESARSFGYASFSEFLLSEALSSVVQVNVSAKRNADNEHIMEAQEEGNAHYAELYRKTKALLNRTSAENRQFSQRLQTLQQEANETAALLREKNGELQRLEHLELSFECIICRDRAIEVVYGCGHGTCEACNEKWTRRIPASDASTDPANRFRPAASRLPEQAPLVNSDPPKCPKCAGQITTQIRFYGN